MICIPDKSGSGNSLGKERLWLAIDIRRIPEVRIVFHIARHWPLNIGELVPRIWEIHRGVGEAEIKQPDGILLRGTAEVGVLGQGSTARSDGILGHVDDDDIRRTKLEQAIPVRAEPATISGTIASSYCGWVTIAILGCTCWNI